jgi:hypothetical protein
VVWWFLFGAGGGNLTFQSVEDGHGTARAGGGIARDFDLVGRGDFFNGGSGLFSVRL